MLRTLFFSSLIAVSGIALAELSTDQPLRINDTLSTETARATQPRISIRSIGVVELDEVDTLVIVADMPDADRNDVTRTPAAAIGNRQIDCDVENVDPFQVNTRIFECSVDDLLLGATNRVCVGYLEAFQFGIDQDLTVYEANRCIDFLYR